MKKILLLAAAFFVATASFAQENLAIGGTATATAGVNPGDAIDGYEGTSWEAPNKYFADNNTETVEWTLDLKESKTFNTIQILWENAYSKSFTISVSDDNNNYEMLLTISDQNLADNKLQTCSFNAVTKRYIKFTNIERIDKSWGVRFWEFRVFNVAEKMVLNTIEFSSPANPLVKKGTSVTLTGAKGKDQLGKDIDIPNLTYTITEGEGNINGDVFTPAKEGVAKIKAMSGEIASNEITYYVHSNDKIAINSEKVTLIGEGTVVDNKDGGIANAFDDNLGSPWKLHADTSDDTDARTYETGFVVDLEGLYDITDVHIKFEGASSEAYSVSFSADGTNYGDVLSGGTGAYGTKAFTDFFQSYATGVKYVKFLSTKAATQYGVKMFDFSIYGTESTYVPSDDKTAPTWAENDAAVVTEIKATSAIVTVSANDNNANGKLIYTVTETNSKVNEQTFNGIVNGATQIEIKDLTPATKYNFSISVKDLAGNTAEAVQEVSFTTTEDITVADDTDKDMCVIKGTVGSVATLEDALKDETKTAYDITGLTFPETVTSFKVGNPNAMIIVTDEQATQLTNMKNLFWLKNNAYFISRGVYEITDGYPVYTKFFISAEKGYTYTREISGGKYVTTTLPAGVTLPAGISAYEFGYSKDNVYTFNKKADKELKAHTPYILYSAEKTLLTVTVTGNTDLDMGNGNIKDIVCGDLTFHGNYETFAGDGSQYGLFNNSAENSIVLKKVDGGTIGAFRGYFTINGTTSDAKDIRFIFNNGGTDGISSVNSETTVNAANVYTIDGRFVNSNGSVAGLAKGLYIVGGKKVIVK